jgi:hypothetical protein
MMLIPKSSRRSIAFWLVLMPVVIVLFYWKSLLTHQFTIIIGTEGVNMDWAWLHFLGDSFRHGRLPLWDPWEFAGAPFAGSLQPAVYYPLQILLAVLPLTHDGYVSSSFFHESLAFAHLLGAWFGFALLREMQCSRFSAFVGGCVFALSGMVVRIMWPLYIDSYIWLPAIFLFLIRALGSKRTDRAILQAAFCGFCLAMSIFTGGLSFFIMQAVCIIGAIAWHSAVKRPAIPPLWPHWIRSAAIAAVTFLLAAGLSAVQLIPANEYAKQSLRYIDRGPFPSAEKIPFDRLLSGVWPQSIATGLFPAGYNGQFGNEFFSFYAGVFPLVLAVIAIWKRWENLWVRYLAILALFAFIYCLGELSPLYGIVYATVPMLWSIRSAGRFVYLISFPLAILAAMGLDEILERGTAPGLWDRARPFVKWTAIAATAALLLPALYTQVQLGMWNAFSLLLILASCGWLAWLTSHSATNGTRAALAAFILFDLAAFNWIEMDSNPNRSGDHQMEQMLSLRGATGFVKRQPGLHRVYVDVAESPNIGDVYGVESVSGGGATALTSYSRLGLHYDLLNVEYTIKPSSAPDPNPLYQDAKWKVYRKPGAFPRAWLVHRTITAPSQNSAFQLLDQQDLHTVAIVENAISNTAQPGNSGIESVRFRSWAPEKFTVDVNAVSNGLLVLSEMYYPGWRATVNGKPAEIHRVDGALRGIAVSPGSNRIEMEYAPASFRIGAGISVATLLLFLAGWVYISKRTAAPGSNHFTINASTSAK